METLKFDLSKKDSNIKIFNATNGGPWASKGWDHDDLSKQVRTNFFTYKAARIPYSRNHDSGVVPLYGGPYSHDVTRIFPRFEADPDDPASYDFACTDNDIKTCLDAGTKTFFRLGQTIEHQVKKHGTIPPPDFKKWAVICEHIIRHYTEGWADGFYYDMPYWEIWNEPDLDPDDSDNKRTWGGTKAQFFDFYEIAAKHLKARFPHLKIGGPAVSGKVDWSEEFLCEMQKRNVPIDFFSWHVYLHNIEKLTDRANKMKALLVKYGYEKAESILNEWNYVKGWEGEEMLYTVKQHIGLKNASFITACMSAAQHCSIDMLMYYDTRPGMWCGIFEYYTHATLKGYYPMMWYGKFYDMQYMTYAKNEIDGIYSLCSVDKNGKSLTMLTYYSDEDNAPSRQIKLELGKTAEYEVYVVDGEHDGECIGTLTELQFDLAVHTCLLIKEK